jgi:hypothetical protein
MNFRRTDQMIAELLDDPMVQMIMHADRVDRDALAADLCRIACRLDNAEGRSTKASPRQFGRARKAPAWVKAGWPLCGACCA